MATMDVTYTVACPDGVLSYTVTSTGTGFYSVSDSVPDSTTDQLVSISFTLAQLKGFAFIADGALTLETNATNHAGGDQITIDANEPLIWQTGGYHANPFTNDVTKFYLTNASGATVNYYIRVITDGTP